jgi:hypothetical protein
MLTYTEAIMSFLHKISASLVLASPLEIDDTDFNYEDAEFNQAEYAKYRNKSPQLIHKFSQTIGLFKVKDHFFVFNDDQHRILFCVKYAVIPFLSYNFVVQKKIWRDSALSVDAFKIDGMSVASYVFFNQLLPMADGIGIITDSMQTPSGKRFWFDRIAQAFSKNLHVYLMDRNKKIKIKLHDDADFKAKIKQEDTWTSDDNKSLNRRVVISKKEL